MTSEKLNVTITYLEQTARPTKPAPPCPAGKSAIMRAEQPPAAFYRFLFNAVGEPWRWVSRRYLDDAKLESILHDAQVYIYVLYWNGVPCGMAEIDARRDHQRAGEIELKFFGLMPHVTGLGLGNWFLHNAIDLAWSFDPKRVILETCTADHPAALPLYQKFGFRPYSQATGVIEWRG
ncbi:MAG: GNAT family N-acetyltransferase [Parvularculaceae bacterium]